jgi:hypothetical protein
MTVLVSPVPRIHLATPVDDPAAAFAKDSQVLAA